MAPAPTRAGYGFFDADDALFVEAAVDRLIPSDAAGPGARNAGVVLFIDRQLAGPWDIGDRLYRSGTWHAGRLLHGYRLPRTPGVLFHSALRGIEADLAQRPRADSEHIGQATQRQAGRGIQLASLTSPRSPPSGRRRFAQFAPAAQDSYLQALKAGEKMLGEVPSQVFYDCLLSLTIEGFFGDPRLSGNEDTFAARHL